MFETKAELADLQRLLDESFEKAKQPLYSGFDESNRLSARQLAGFQGIRLMAVATVNANGEPRAAPRSAALLHGKFYLAANSKSTTVRRLARNPTLGLGFTYFENHLLIMGHGVASPLREGTPGFKELSPEWVAAFQGGDNALEGMDLLIRIDATHLIAFAVSPERYPEGWGSLRPHAKRARKAS